MKLQILVPQYKETDEVVKTLLDSIALQQGIDFNDVGVIICNDGSDVFLSDEWLKSYPFEIQYHKEPHRGVSGTRNACLAKATADYVMFCDADDMFYNVCGLFIIFMSIEHGFDALNSPFLEEAMEKPSMKPVYVMHKDDSTFVHGKVYRRGFLVDNGLLWNENLSVHEDSYFNVLCLELAKDVKYSETPFYLWKWRNDSVCRCDPLYTLKTYNDLIDSTDALAEEFIKRNCVGKASHCVCYSILETYYMMNKPMWNDPDNKVYRDRTEARFGEFFRKWEYLWDAKSAKEKTALSRKAREKVIGEGMGLELFTIYEWLKRHKEKT